jgi:ABC-type polysaccharide/polyol phosphate transport system ATPase subunit
MNSLIFCNSIEIKIGSTVIRKNISINFKEGDILIITGSNGSGKSTLLRFLSGSFFHKGIYINGNPSKLMNISGGFDKFLSAKDNILKLGILFKLINGNPAVFLDNVLKIASLKNNILNEKTSILSHGTIMRLAFAVCYLDAKYKDFLVMDEWLSVGDLEFKSKAEKLLRDLIINSNKGLILATNSIVPVFKSTQVILNLDLEG